VYNRFSSDTRVAPQGARASGFSAESDVTRLAQVISIVRVGVSSTNCWDASRTKLNSPYEFDDTVLTSLWT